MFGLTTCSVAYFSSSGCLLVLMALFKFCQCLCFFYLNLPICSNVLLQTLPGFTVVARLNWKNKHIFLGITLHIRLNMCSWSSPIPDLPSCNSSDLLHVFMVVLMFWSFNNDSDNNSTFVIISIGNLIKRNHWCTINWVLFVNVFLVNFNS